MTRLTPPERELSARMDMSDVMRLFSGQADLSALLSTQTLDYGSVWGQQHCDVLANFAANNRDGEPLVAPGAEGIHGVRLANAIHLSAWSGREVSITDFDEAAYERELRSRIAAEGLFERVI